jgi:hypothetical protein
LIAYKGLWAATAKKDEDGITSDNYTEITSLNFVIYMLFQTLSIRGLVIRSSSTPSMRSFLTVFLRQDVSLRNPWEMAKALHADPSNSIENICKTLHITRAKLYRYVGKANKHQPVKNG